MTNCGEADPKSLEKMCALHSTESVSYCQKRNGMGDVFVGGNHPDRRKNVSSAGLEEVVLGHDDQKTRLSEKLASAEGSDVTQ